MKIPRIIEGEKVKLMLVDRADAERIAELINDKEVVRYLGKEVPYPYKLKDAKDWIRKFGKNSEEFNMVIISKQSDEIVGVIGLSEMFDEGDSKKAYIGYWLGKKYWGKGYAKEAARLLVDYGFREMGLLRLYTIVYEPNIISAKILENIGFQREGMLRQHIQSRFDKDQWWNAFTYGLLRKEWRK